MKYNSDRPFNWTLKRREQLKRVNRRALAGFDLAGRSSLDQTLRGSEGSPQIDCCPRRRRTSRRDTLTCEQQIRGSRWLGTQHFERALGVFTILCLRHHQNPENISWLRSCSEGEGEVNVGRGFWNDR